MVFGLVKQSGGYISVDSQLGKGTTFKVYLEQEPTPDPETDTNVKDLSPKGGVENILVIDDEAPVGQFIKIVLEESGYNVVFVETGAKAVEIVQNQTAYFDLVISDVMLPDIKGNILLGILRHTDKALKGLYISGYSGEQLYKNLDMDKGTKLLKKPFDPDDLLREVRQVLDEKLTDEPK